jgi:PIN domain nuclease of toxin-antitoxin system
LRLLLDTHAFVWWLAGDNSLSRRARKLITEDGNEIYVSAASAWEVATKVRIGKMPSAVQLASDFPAQVAQQEFIGLDITLEHGQRAGSLPGPLRDPFDRMLIAQAQAENLALISIENVFDSYGLVRVW